MNRRAGAHVVAVATVMYAMPAEPNVAFARDLLADHDRDNERLRLAVPELMAAAETARERDEVRRLVQRMLTGPGAFAEPRWLDMRAAERVAASALAWAIQRPDLVSGVRRRRTPLPIGSADWHEELMLTLAACWEAMAAESPNAPRLIADSLAARRRDRGVHERRWLQDAPGGRQLERGQQLRATRALLEATHAAVRGNGDLAQRRLAHVHRSDALGLLGLAHLARELSACVRFRLGANPS
jgi:hypothetical protein